MTINSAAVAVPTYVAIAKGEASYVARFEKSNAVTKADLAYFQKQAPKLTTVDALMKDRRSLAIVLEAFGMSENVDQKALVRKLMTEDSTKSSSFAAKSGNTNYQRFATAMAQYKVAPFSNATNVKAVIDSVGQSRFEAAQDSQNDGMEAALYFRRQSKNITNVNQIMADKKLLAVVTKAADLPDQFGVMDYDKQIALLKKKLDITKLKDVAFVDKFVKRYLVVHASDNAVINDTSGALSILNGSGGSSDVLAALYPQKSTSGSSILSLFA